MKAKYFLVVLAFAACLVLVMAARQALSGEFKIHHLDFYDNRGDWDNFQFENIIINQDSSKLLLDTQDKPGVLQSPVIETAFDFDEILLSWNCLVDRPGGLHIYIGLSRDNNSWHELDYQTWGVAGPDDDLDLPEYPTKINGIGRLDEDIIRLSESMRYYRFKAYCFSGETGQFSLDRISVCYTNTSANIRMYSQNSPGTTEIVPVELAVPYRSQHWLPDSIAGLTCSPTSVTMVLNYYGREYSHLEVAGEVYDKYNDIYGNWPYNVQAAYLLGMKKTWVGRHNSFAELADELKNGKPVIISIAAEEGQLSNAPYSRTDGHLIVIRGFDSEGNVLVNDPAGDNVAEGIVTYNIDELTAVWTGYQGVAYHLWPE